MVEDVFGKRGMMQESVLGQAGYTSLTQHVSFPR